MISCYKMLVGVLSSFCFGLVFSPSLFPWIQYDMRVFSGFGIPGVQTAAVTLWTWVVCLFVCFVFVFSSYFKEGRKEMFYLTTHSTHFIYGYMASDHSDSKWGNLCRHIGYSFRLAARVLLYASSHRQDNTYHSLCYTSCGALAGTRNTSWKLI